MALIYTKGISPQGRALYLLLLTKGKMTAQEIAKHLHIHPNAVYRLAHYLAGVGFIEETRERPVRFQALPPGEGSEKYLSFQRRQIDQMFDSLPQTLKKESAKPEYQISFIVGREEIFQRVADDLNDAKKEAKFIVLGLPIGISPELLLAQRRAVERGVPVRIVVQEYSDENRETLRSWKTQGLDVRVGKPLGFHLLLIDEAISYLMYYDPQEKTKRYAVRIVHPAINSELQALFNTHWRMAKPLEVEGNGHIPEDVDQNRGNE